MNRRSYSCQSLLLMVAVLFLGDLGFNDSVCAQEEEQVNIVLENFVDAVGGQMVLESLETLKVKGKYSGSSKGKSQFYKKGQWRLDVMSSSSNITDGKRWFKSGRDEQWVEETTGDQLHLRGALFDIPTDSLALLDLAERMRVVDPSEYADSAYAKCICLVENFADNRSTRRYFDRESGLLVCVERYKSGSQLAVRYGEMKYVEYEGIMFLKSSVRTNSSDWKCIAEYSDFEIDVEIDDSLFDLETDDD